MTISMCANMKGQGLGSVEIKLIFPFQITESQYFVVLMK